MKIIEVAEQQRWDDFVTSHLEANFLQSWDFYEFHKNRGKKIVRRAVVDDKNEIIAAYAGVVETAKRGTYMAIAGGPIIDYNDKKLVREIFADIYRAGKEAGCVFVRIRPQLPLSDRSLRLMQELGLKKAPMYLSVEYAGILDLGKSEEEILAGASQGFRRKLRKAEKNNIEIVANAEKWAIEEFCKLEKKHAERQKYVAFSSSFLTKQFEAFAKNNEVLIYTAKKDGEILAQNFMIFYGAEASYHYGVSSQLGTKYSAAPLLHMAAMREARKRGCRRYNLWGIVGLEEKSHRFYGVSEFKRSFGCEELKYTPAHDMILSPVKYQITKIIETARKRKRHV
ncbi:lipid II:glycine glycyltransferase FemX [Candidatus Nanosyncoccus alces]|uniref:Aminoacyltransferase FemA n=1 Tax=Candidatus Nanosyncoccus alces TaxID=2171997 RepID=A0ABY0FLC8_9BACT|nr:peptidoglycan bridge formation glycyltransferase FemA/FemB family protein [Candidatus Nanosyncoccus alces]RYC74557.1 Aminoacyltransferase FemA [Candidatus Nanosyncoccus alces]